MITCVRIAQSDRLKECSGHALPTITDTQERIYKPFQTFWRRRKWAIIIYAAAFLRSFCSSDFCWKFACVQKCAKNHERMSLVPSSKEAHKETKMLLQCNSQNITTNCCIWSSIIQMFVILLSPFFFLFIPAKLHVDSRTNFAQWICGLASLETNFYLLFPNANVCFYLELRVAEKCHFLDC